MEEQGILLVCRPGFEPFLAQEVRGLPGVDLVSAPGTVWVRGGAASPARFIFERQRLPKVHWFPAEGEGPLARRLLAWIAPCLGSAAAPWTLHAFAADPQGTPGLAGRAGKLKKALEEQCKRTYPDLYARVPTAPESAERKGTMVAQVCLTAAGAWASVAPIAHLSSPWPGGVHRLHAHSEAPSRSHLKLEEAIEVLGVQPRPGERVVDLGAAPGGWSYAFLRRGCRVWAIDNGPLKLRHAADLPGQLIHLRTDGMTYRPAAQHLPLDWLVADMLITPGQVLGLLRRWIGQRWMRRFVVNIKLPQREPLVAVRPISAYLADQEHLSWQVRHLYHDRREVTLVGELRPGKPARTRRRGTQ